jgi:2-polyprenyl-6-methoxyphenol hydroxylase-like FAD-dependent oxidoreductase
MLAKMSSSPPRPHAVIVGASVAGLASACALAKADWRVTLLERRPDLSEGGQGLLLQPNGLAALDRLGALERVRERGMEIGAVLMYESHRRPSATYDYSELRHSYAFLIEIRPRALRAALADRAAELEVEPHFGSEVTDLVRRGGSVAEVRCADGFETTADLVVGADGRGSRSRAALGIPCREVGPTGAYVLGTVDVVRDTADIHAYCGDGYANGVCPLPDGTYFWDCITDDNRNAVRARDLDGWRRVYERRVPCAVDFIDAVREWSELSEVAVRPFWAARRLAPGAVLVGDAAGSVHPHAGQGANLALEDAADLGAALVESSGSQAALAELLPGFGRARDRKLRRYVLWSLVAAATLDGPNRIWRSVRRASFRSSRIRPLRRLALRQQAGLG